MGSIDGQKFLDVLGQINLDDMHIQQAFEFYQLRFRESKVAQQFVDTSGLIGEPRDQNLVFGYVDRTLGKHIPRKKTPEGAAIRGSLLRCGLVRASGHELFRGCVVLPAFDVNGNISSAVGYRIGRIRSGDKPVVYWRRPEPKAFVDSGMTFAKEIAHGQAYH